MFSRIIGCLASVCAWTWVKFCNLWSRPVETIMGQVVPQLNWQAVCVSKNAKWIEDKKNKVTTRPINSTIAKCRKFRHSRKNVMCNMWYPLVNLLHASCFLFAGLTLRPWRWKWYGSPKRQLIHWTTRRYIPEERKCLRRLWDHVMRRVDSVTEDTSCLLKGISDLEVPEKLCCR
jgi:hypothetical protein